MAVGICTWDCTLSKPCEKTAQPRAPNVCLALLEHRIWADIYTHVTCMNVCMHMHACTNACMCIWTQQAHLSGRGKAQWQVTSNYSWWGPRPSHCHSYSAVVELSYKRCMPGLNIIIVARPEVAQSSVLSGNSSSFEYRIPTVCGRPIFATSLP